MTRGTFYLIYKNQVITSCEFNGDMYGSPKDSKKEQLCGNYKLAVQKLKKARGVRSFENRIKEFDHEAGFDYQTELDGYFTFYKYWLQRFLNKKGEIDMREKKYFDLFFSDYIYIKNLSGEDWKVRNYNGRDTSIIPDGKIATFYFGRPIEVI